MRTGFVLSDGLELALAAPDRVPADGLSYPTASLQRGLLPADGDGRLCGEGVGFGVPVLKRGTRAVFAGVAHMATHGDDPRTITVTYVMDRAERLGGRRSATPILAQLDLVRELFAALYRRVPALRRGLMAVSNSVRMLLRVRTRFEPIPEVALIPVSYTLDEDGDGVRVRVDLADLPPQVTEVAVMNELGADYFDRYREEGGRTETGRRIGAWDRVRGASATFTGGSGDVWFRLDRAPDPSVPGAQLYRGREAVRGRLAWAGFGYSLRPGPSSFTYTVHIGRGAPG